MTAHCLRCGDSAEGRFRPVMGRGRMERLCVKCADDLSTLVRAAGETCQLSLADARFSAWLDTGRWKTRDGQWLGSEDVPGGHQAVDCPCCAIFAEEGD